jgi:hypothetical protein
MEGVDLTAIRRTLLRTPKQRWQTYSYPQCKGASVMQQEATPQIDQATDAESSTSEDRRAFLSRATGLAVTAPAATLLLAASTRRASAQRLGSVIPG